LLVTGGLALLSGCTSLHEDPPPPKLPELAKLGGKKTLAIVGLRPSERRYRSRAFERSLVETLTASGAFKAVAYPAAEDEVADLRVSFTYHGDYESNLLQNFWLVLLFPMAFFDGVTVTSNLLLQGAVYHGSLPDAKEEKFLGRVSIESKDRNPFFVLNIIYFLPHSLFIMGRRQIIGNEVHRRYGANLGRQFISKVLLQDERTPGKVRPWVVPASKRPKIAIIRMVTKADWALAQTDHMFITGFTKTRAFRVLPGADRDKILKEHGWNVDAAVSPEEGKAIELGKMLAARYLIMGRVGGLFGRAEFDIRVMDGQTGEVLEATSRSAGHPRLIRRTVYSIVNELTDVVIKRLKLEGKSD